MVDARGSLPYAYPRLPRLELKAHGRGGTTRTRQDKRRLLARTSGCPGRVRFFLDTAVYADTARALLPEIAGYGAGLIDHLFRAEIRIDTGTAALRWCRSSARGAAFGRARSASSPRTGRACASRSRRSSRPSAGVRVTVPAGTKKVAAVLRGEDDAGELVAVGESAIR